jgi:hypothetical protein
MRMFVLAGDVSAVLLYITDFATLAALQGDVEREVRLVAAMRRLQRLTGIDLVDHPVNEVPGLEATLERLGADGARLLAEGAGMDDDEVVAYALHRPSEG